MGPVSIWNIFVGQSRGDLEQPQARFLIQFVPRVNDPTLGEIRVVGHELNCGAGLFEAFGEYARDSASYLLRLSFKMTMLRDTNS